MFVTHKKKQQKKKKKKKKERKKIKNTKKYMNKTMAERQELQKCIY